MTGAAEQHQDRHLQEFGENGFNFGPELFVDEGFPTDDVDDEKHVPIGVPTTQSHQSPEPEFDDG